MIILLFQSLKSDILRLVRISEKLKNYEAELRKADSIQADCFHSVFIIYVVNAGDIQIERPFKNLEGKKKHPMRAQCLPLRSKLFL